MLRKLIKELTLAVFITASCNITLDLYSDYLRHQEIERISRETGFTITVCTFGPRTELVARFYVEVFLIVALIGTRLKGLGSTLLSAIGLSGAVVGYIFWWQYIFRIMRNAETTADAIPNFAFLAHGTFVDVAIAAGIALLVVLNVLDAAASSFRLNPEIGNHDSSKGPSQTKPGAVSHKITS
jgi:hypothetical protein